VGTSAQTGCRATTLEEDLPSTRLSEPHWDLAFIGILAYLFVEFTRLPEMFPVLAVLHVGWIALGMSALGHLISPPSLRVPVPGRLVIDLAMGAFFFANFISACFADFPEPAWEGVKVSLSWLAVYFLISRIVNNSWRLRVFVFVYLLLNLKLAQFAVRYYFFQRRFYDEMVVITQGAGAGATGFFGNSADLGVAMCVVWPVALCLLFSKPKGLYKFFLLACSATYLVAILLCGSRGAVVGACGVALAGWGRSPKKLVAFLMVVLLLPGIYFVLPDASKERFQSAANWEQDATASSRIRFWKAGLHMFRTHPIFGIGPGNFPETYAASYGEQDPGLRPVQHSIYVQSLSEFGAFGSLAVLALFLQYVRLNGRTRKRLSELGPSEKQSREYWLAVGLDLALVGFLVSGVFVSVLVYPHLWFLLSLSVSLGTVVARNEWARGLAEQVQGDSELVPAGS